MDPGRSGSKFPSNSQRETTSLLELDMETGVTQRAADPFRREPKLAVAALVKRPTLLLAKVDEVVNENGP